jgi:release factor glutamine methyltransferase
VAPRLDEILKKTTDHFNARGIPSARLDAELILAHALKWKRLDLYLKFDYPMKDEELAHSREMVIRRVKGEPVAYILGHREFYKADFIVRPGVLVPRPDTELIVELAVEELKRDALASVESPVIWDFGIGTGCIGLSLLGEAQTACLVGVDISEVALAVATENADRLNLSTRSKFIQADAGVLTRDDVVEQLDSKFPDIIVGNPPYISEDDHDVQESVKKFEPAEALFSADQGLSHFKSWAKVAAQLLKPGGFFAFEIGSKQGAAVREFLGTIPCFVEVQIKKDLAGLERAVCGRKQMNTKE